MNLAWYVWFLEMMEMFLIEGIMDVMNSAAALANVNKGLARVADDSKGRTDVPECLKTATKDS